MEKEEVYSKEDLIPFGEAFFQRSARAKRKYEQQALLDLSYLVGDQNVYMNERTSQLVRTHTEYDPDWHINVVDNRILPVYRALMSKMTKNMPIPLSRANTDEEKDIKAARAAKKLLNYHWDLLELSELHPIIVGWVISTGNCFLKPFWNPKKGDRIPVYDNIDFMGGLSESGLPKLKLDQLKDMVTVGEVDIAIRSPFNIYPEPGQSELSKMAMFGDAEMVSVDVIKEVYGVTVEPGKSQYASINMNLDSMISSGLLETKNEERMAEVKELSVLPCKKFPQGIRFKWAGKELLGKPGPYPRLELIQFGLIYIPGQFWRQGIVTAMRPLQERKNRLLSKIEMHNDYYAHPPMFVDDTVIDPELITGEPGQINTAITPGSDLSRAVYIPQVPPLDPNIYRELDIIDKELELVPVMNKVSFGTDTPNARSGIAINFLQEKDDDVVRPLVSAIELSYAKLFKQVFEICKDNWKEDRGISVVGEDNKSEYINFEQAFFDGNIHVGVEPNSAMPRSKVAQQAMVLDMLEKGFFNDPRTGRPDFVKAMKYMEFGNVDQIYEDSALDSNQAQRVLDRLKLGELIQPQDWYAIDVHIYEINRFRKSAEYEGLDQGGQQAIDQYVAACIALMTPPAGVNPAEIIEGMPPDKQISLAQLPPAIQNLQMAQMTIQQLQGQMKQIQAEAERDTPLENIAFKDLPPAGKVQMAAQAGIQLDPQEIQAAELMNQVIKSPAQPSLRADQPK